MCVCVSACVCRFVYAGVCWFIGRPWLHARSSRLLHIRVALLSFALAVDSDNNDDNNENDDPDEYDDREDNTDDGRLDDDDDDDDDGDRAAR